MGLQNLSIRSGVMLLSVAGSDCRMNDEEVKPAFVSALSKLPSERKLYALAVLVHNLTVSARAVYAERDEREDTVERLYTLNEMQQTLSNQMIHMANDINDYTDVFFIDQLYSYASSGHCEHELTWALKFT